jgi:hypothetical protein
MRIAIASVLALIGVTPLLAQQTTVTAIPHLVRFTGTFHPVNGLPVGPTESVTLSVYADEQGGTPLWQETQNVAVDADGHYTAVLGATQNDGVPLDLFTAASPRWLGVMFNRPGETEQPRVQLVSVPYAMRAADSETLGGRPASSYLLDPNAATTGNTSTGAATAASSASAKSLKPRETFGTTNYIPYFTDNTGDFGNSTLYQSGNNIGIGTTIPAYPLSIGGTYHALGSAITIPNLGSYATADSAGNYRSLFFLDNSNPDILHVRNNQRGAGGAISFESQTGGAPSVTILSNGNVGIGTSTPAATLDVAGNINFSGLISYQTTSGPAPVQQFSATTNNAATGINALGTVGTGSGTSNTAVGNSALSADKNGSTNTAIGYTALFTNTGGDSNTAVGAQALELTNGSDSTQGSGNTAIGFNALDGNSTGNSNIAIGLDAGSAITGSNNIDIGNNGNPNDGTSSDSGVIRIGTLGTQTSFYAAGVSNVNLGSDSNAVEVEIDTTTGQLGVATSSRRFKEDIRDMGDASSGLMRLRPVTFRYKQPANDGSKPIEYGLIAEEVAKVYPDLVAHSADGQIETVRYQVLDSMLLNEMQKQQQQIGQQEEHIQKLEEQNRALQERLEKLEAAMGAGSR